MIRAALITFAFALLIGCKKKDEESSGGGGGNAGAGPNPPASQPTGEWSVVGDVAVRVEKVRVQKPVVIERKLGEKDGKEKELAEPELMVWVTIENRTKTQKIDYHGWDFTFGQQQPGVVDEYGNKYKLRSHLNIYESLKGHAKGGALNPGDAPVTDIICFEKPIPSATKLILTLPSLTPNQKGSHQFEVPATALTGGGQIRAIAGKSPETTSPKKSKGDKPPTKASTPEEDGAKYAGLKEWSRVGDVQVRVMNAKVMRVPLKTFTGREYLSKEPELVLGVQIQNLSKVKKLDYHRWKSLFRDDVSISDEHGNVYRLNDHDNFNSDDQYKTIQPDGPVHVDLLSIEPPVAPATELRIVLPSLVSDEKEKYRFKIPASTWK